MSPNFGEIKATSVDSNKYGETTDMAYFLLFKYRHLGCVCVCIPLKEASSKTDL